MDLTEIKKATESLQREYQEALSLKKSEKQKLEEVKSSLQDYLEAHKIAQEIAEQIQRYVHKQIAEVVNKCLRVVFDDLYEFRISFISKRGKTEAQLEFIKKGKVIQDTGGGVVDVASFALRLSSLLLNKKKISRTIILDQPFSNVSKDKGYLERIPDMLMMLSEEFDIQFIQVNHTEELKIGEIIEL